MSFDEFTLPVEQAAPQVKVGSMPKLGVTREENRLRIEGRDFFAELDVKSGEWLSWKHRDQELLERGPRPNYWRPPTDNDLGNKMDKRCGVWRRAGQNRILKSFDFVELDERRVRIRIEYSIPVGETKQWVVYTFFGSGDVLVENQIEVDPGKTPEVPRFGMMMELAPRFENMSWYGRGPHESYWDRKTGAEVGVYSGAVWDQYFPYTRPQENGNKTDVRWVALTDEQGRGVMAARVGKDLLSASAYHFRQEELDVEKGRYRHINDIAKQNLVTFNVDHRQMGVGGDNSWGALPHPEYLLTEKSYSYAFRMRAFSKEDGDPATLSRLDFKGQLSLAGSR